MAFRMKGVEVRVVILLAVGLVGVVGRSRHGLSVGIRVEGRCIQKYIYLVLP